MINIRDMTATAKDLEAAIERLKLRDPRGLAEIAAKTVSKGLPYSLGRQGRDLALCGDNSDEIRPDGKKRLPQARFRVLEALIRVAGHRHPGIDPRDWAKLLQLPVKGDFAIVRPPKATAPKPATRKTRTKKPTKAPAAAKLEPASAAERSDTGWRPMFASIDSLGKGAQDYERASEVDIRSRRGLARAVEMIADEAQNLDNLGDLSGWVSSLDSIVEGVVDRYNAGEDVEELAAPLGVLWRPDVWRAVRSIAAFEEGSEMDRMQEDVDAIKYKIGGLDAEDEDDNAEIRKLQTELAEKESELKTLETAYKKARSDEDQILSDILRDLRVLQIRKNPSKRPKRR